MNSLRHIMILGGGITGLAAAFHLRQQVAADGPPLRITLLEATSRVGGAIRTITHEHITPQGQALRFLIELGPDNFITNKPGAIDLCRRLNLDDQLLPTNDQHRRALVVRRGRLLPIPEGFELMAPRNLYALARSPIFSLAGKLRMWCEQFIRPRRDGADESLQSFVVRRFGRQALDRLIQPLIGGIYTADPALLSLRATVPRFLDMEAKHGSIIRAIRHEKRNQPPSSAAKDSGARYSLFMTLRDGMETLPQTLGAALRDAIRLDTAATAIERGVDGQTWRVHLSDGSSLDADAILFATPTPVTARLLAPLDEPVSQAIGSITSASSALVVLAYRREQVKHPLDAFGFVVPAIENRSIIAGSFSHVKYAGRAPQDCVLLRAFIGGATQERMMAQSDGQMIDSVQREFGELLGVTGAPLVALVQRWPGSMPQYQVGHVDLVASIRAKLAGNPALAGLAVAGSAYDGVGIPDCITSGEQQATRLMEGLAGRLTSA